MKNPLTIAPLTDEEKTFIETLTPLSACGWLRRRAGVHTAMDYDTEIEPLHDLTEASHKAGESIEDGARAALESVYGTEEG
jgi:hypothetical protein